MMDPIELMTCFSFSTSLISLLGFDKVTINSRMRTWLGLCVSVFTFQHHPAVIFCSFFGFGFNGIRFLIIAPTTRTTLLTL
ncbi:hypothetical protein Lalb_Chr11g0065061 [Lupinus albus]|uniref:Uncharacterized protein n=1 Tax=Lupinus albus TaxID=3870 RepID=A0A6A4PQT5_LUPAL|nr:hypothetical protein Lalb_Chr11g0065061 [Lupinus albus]